MKIASIQYYLLGVLLGCLCLTGCNGYIDHAGSQPALGERFTTIDAVQLTDESVSEPITVEEATEQMTQQTFDPNEPNEPNEPGRSVTITLADVRAAALENNLDLKVELIDPSIAKRTLDVERAKFEAVFFGSMGYDDTEGLGTGSVSRTSSSDVGISKELPIGGSIEVALPFSDTDPGGLASASASVTYIQSLARGVGTRINEQSIRIAEHQWNIAGTRTKLATINLLAGADITYWRLYASRKELEVRQEQYALAEEQLNHAEKKVAAGSAPKIEIVRAEAGLASRLEGVINAETAVEFWAREMRRIMNDPELPLESDLDLIPQTEPNPLGLDLDREALVQKALANRMDMAALEQQLTIDDLNVELARNASLPDVTLSYGYAARTLNSSEGGALSDITRNNYDDHSIGLSAVIPLGNRAAKARLDRARLIRIQDRASRNQLQQIIQQDVYEAVSDLARDWRRILAAEQGVLAAYRDYRVEQSQFQLGQRTSTDVLFSATRLADAQLSRIRAFADYEISQINLARATGTILGYGKVSLEPADLDSESKQ